jgi:hypothetical protein
MTCEPSVPIRVDATLTPSDCRKHHSLCWGAVLAGTIAAIGIHLLLTTLGIGAGLAPFKPVTDSQPIVLFSTGTGLVWSLFAIIALSLGGWLAGRLSGCPKSGWMHGVLVWSLTLIITLPLLTLGTSLTVARAGKQEGSVPDPSPQRVAIAEHDLSKLIAKRSEVQLCSFVEEAVQSVPTNAEPKADTRAEREVGFAVNKLFSPGNAPAFTANRLEAINTLMVYTAMSAADATITMDAWITSRKNLQGELDKLKAEMNNLKMAAEQNSRATAEAAAEAAANQAARQLSRVSTWSFFALLLGLLGAVLGGRCGAECAWRNANLPRTP